MREVLDFRYPHQKFAFSCRSWASLAELEGERKRSVGVFGEIKSGSPLLLELCSCFSFYFLFHSRDVDDDCI